MVILKHKTDSMKTNFQVVFLLLTLIFAGCKQDDDIEIPVRNNLKLTVSAPSVILDQEKLDEPALTFTWNEATKMGDDYAFTYLFQIDIANNNFETATAPVALDANGTISFTTSELYDLIVEKWKRTAGETVEIEARVAAKVTGPKFQYPEIASLIAEVKTFVPVSQPLYLVGTATAGGMEPADATRMNELSNGKIYNWKGALKVGSFKFIRSVESMLPSYNRGQDDQTIVERTQESEPDDYFEVTQAGTYYIYLSKKDMSVLYKRVLYETLYMVGNATAAGWSTDNALMMVPNEMNPNIFSYQGVLNEGEMKILTRREWNSPTFKPLVANGSIASEEVQITPGEQPDYKWLIKADEVGLYKITIDTELLTIKFEKL